MSQWPIRAVSALVGTMRPCRGWRFSAVLLGLALAAEVFAQSAGEPAERTPLLFLGNQNIAPVVYLDKGASTGVAVAIVRAMAAHLSRPAEVRAMDWAEAQALVTRGAADGLIQINATEARRAIYEFSEPLLQSEFSIFIRTEQVGVTDLESLRGLKVGVEAAGLPRMLIEQDPAIAVRIVPNFKEAFHWLGNGAVDAVVVDRRVGSYVLAENRIRGIRTVGKPIGVSWSAIAVKKGNTALLGEINRALRTIKADGTYDRIIDEWRPKEVVFRTREQIARSVYLTTIIALVVLIVIALLWTLSIRRQLRARRAAEEKLQAQYVTLRGIIEGTHAPIFSVDRHYCYTSFNAAHREQMNALYGTTVEIGKSLLDSMTVATDRETARHNLDRALAGEPVTEQAYSGEELRTRRYFHVSHTPLRTDAGKIIGAAVVAHDITDRKQAEDRMLEFNTELEQRVLQRTTQLQAANKELEAFSYSVSHDLRGPLRSIDGFSRLLMVDYAEKIDDEGRDHLRRIRAASQRMAQLMDDMLSLARLNRAELSWSEINLSALVREIAAQLKESAPARPVEFVIAPDCRTKGDSSLMRSALENLLGNAWKYTSKKPSAKIEFGAMQDPNGDTFFVRDNGCGFDMKYAGKLFAVFQRMHTAQDYPGTGVGLASVQRVIQRHGGRIWVEAEVDRGATFYFTLPRR